MVFFINILKNGSKASIRDFQRGKNGSLVPFAFNSPNPFRPFTEIFFALDSPILGVTLKIFNSRGAEIRNIQVKSNRKKFRWDGKNSKGDFVHSGIYFYQIKNGAKVFKGKMILVR